MPSSKEQFTKEFTRCMAPQEIGTFLNKIETNSPAVQMKLELERIVEEDRFDVMTWLEKMFPGKSTQAEIQSIQAGETSEN